MHSNIVNIKGSIQAALVYTAHQRLAKSPLALHARLVLRAAVPLGAALKFWIAKSPLALRARLALRVAVPNDGSEHSFII